MVAVLYASPHGDLARHEEGRALRHHATYWGTRQRLHSQEPLGNDVGINEASTRKLTGILRLLNGYDLKGEKGGEIGRRKDESQKRKVQRCETANAFVRG